MRVLFCEFLYPKSHARSNSFYIECLSQAVDELHLMSPEEFYEKIPKSVIKHNINKLSMDSGKISYRKNTLYYMWKAYKVIRKNGINKCVVASADYITFLFFKFLVPSLDIYLIHHAELDVLSCNKIKQFVFALYKNKINHIVFEDYIKKYLKNEFKIYSKIMVMPHSLNKNEYIKNTNVYDLVGLSNSNNEEIIYSIIQYEMKTKEFEKRKIFVILKSKKYRYDDGYLKVLNGYLSNLDYNKYINGAKYIFIPFPKYFCYRESGTLMDALSNNKKIIASDIMLVNEYSKLYPEICFVFRDIMDIVSILLENRNTSMQLEEEEFKTFRMKHSHESLIEFYKKNL